MMDNYLTNDMNEAIKQLDFDAKTEKMLRTILFKERACKEKSWDNEATIWLERLVIEEQGESIAEETESLPLMRGLRENSVDGIESKGGDNVVN